MTQAFFDRSGRIARPPYRLLWRELGSFLFDHPAAPDAAVMPRGDGHPVLVIPAFLSGDFATAPLRRFLRDCGFRAEGWGLGVNWGPTPAILDGLQRRLSDLRRKGQGSDGGTVSLIGVSLGGLLARDLARKRAADVRQVITLVSPWHLPTASTIEPAVHVASRFYSHDIDPAGISAPLPVPATSIYTRDDGIVAWQSCFAERPGESVIEVAGPHTTICRNRAALLAVANCLAAAPRRDA